MKKAKGFILIEILISGVILALSVASAMYLFKIGYENIGRADDIYIIHSKFPLALNIIKSNLPDKKYGKEFLGDGVELNWKSEPISRVALKSNEQNFYVYLFKVHFRLLYKEQEKAYEVFILSNEKAR
jgi:hypothetical protein